MRTPISPAPRRAGTVVVTMALAASVLVGLGAAPAGSADFVVNSTADLPLDEVNCPGSPCTLRGAVQAANDAGGGPHTITLGAGTHLLSLSGASEDDNATGDLDVHVPLEIIGAGPEATVITADDLGDRIFDLHASHGPVSFSIEGVQLTRGSQGGGGRGGAIQSATGTVNVTNSTISHNSASGDGGAIRVGSSSTVTIAGTTFDRNSSADDGGVLDMGSGSLVQIAGSTFTDNSAAGDGGMMALNSSSEVTIASSGFSRNTAGADGGAIQLNSGAVLGISGSTFSHNTAGDSGGAVSLNSGATITITDSTFADNVAGDDGGAMETGGDTTLSVGATTFDANDAGRHGGALATSGTNVVTVISSTLSNNRSTRDGGAVRAGSESTVAMANTTVSTNTADERGGAVLLGSGATLEALHATVVDNETKDTTSAGGIDGASLALTNSIVANNTGGDCVGAVVEANGVNLDGDGSCELGAGHFNATDPVLGPLAANGGSTRTHLPLAGSPAIDSADNDPCLATDQRGVARPQIGVAGGEAVCDVGAVERTPCGTVPFSDVPLGHPFCPEITWMAEEDITRGYADGTFRPTADVTRQAMVAFLYRLDGESLGADPTCTEAAFPDVPADHSFCGHITWARDTGIVSGYGDGTFRPGVPVSRQALAAFLYRSAGSPQGADPVCTSAEFTDVPLSHPFCAEIGWLVAAGLANGFADGTFRGGNPISRQAMSAFVFRFSLIAAA
ncbi:MAG: S-layer homology domain-containing protein [Acidimicrobiia bacterium]|nr:S-layer homology domain-containing protein [Acidimicrobiia bacterium]